MVYTWETWENIEDLWQYLILTQPGITFVLWVGSQFMQNGHQLHVKVVFYVLWYLIGPLREVLSFNL